jgi:hypothetical protein
MRGTVISNLLKIKSDTPEKKDAKMRVWWGRSVKRVGEHQLSD